MNQQTRISALTNPLIPATASFLNCSQQGQRKIEKKSHQHAISGTTHSLPGLKPNNMVPRMPHLEPNGIPSISGRSATFREPWLCPLPLPRCRRVSPLATWNTFIRGPHNALLTSALQLFPTPHHAPNPDPLGRRQPELDPHLHRISSLRWTSTS